MNKLAKTIEVLFENFLWKSRWMTLLAVLFALLSSFALFVVGSIEIVSAIIHALPSKTNYSDYNLLLIHIITAIDLYLIAIVVLIFSFGVYELFISKIDPAYEDNHKNILEISSLDDLKNRLLKVIIMALVVYFFKTILSTKFTTPLEMLYLGLSILSVSAGTFFIKKIE